MNKYDVIIGLEIHVELKTNAKAFSLAKNDFGQIPNTTVKSIDLGYPGALPIINKEIVVKALHLATAFNMELANTLSFDRKNYFYWDLPKGYQVTQYYNPIGKNGTVEIIDEDGSPFLISLQQIHLEEDTAKQVHKRKDYIYLDYNRSGVPLIEIVTQPVFKTAFQVIAFLKKLRQILIFLDISDAKMNEGSLRCDVNISLKAKNQKTLNPKVEIKNLNSFVNIQLAIDDEINRQTTLYNSNAIIKSETRKFDENKQKTIFMREKKVINYKFFQEPNFPNITLSAAWKQEIINNMHETPDIALQNLKRLKKLTDSEMEFLLNNYEFYKIFMNTTKLNNLPEANFKFLTGNVANFLNKNKAKLNETKLTSENLANLVVEFHKKNINDQQVKKLLTFIMQDEKKTIQTLILEHDLKQNNDLDFINSLVIQILEKFPESITEYNTKPEKVTKFLIGHLMKISKGQINPVLVSEILKKRIKK